ncbi:methyltransferase domain-containing protein [Alphaproteobacteria bacterium]|nr:methyltransferase domain-containing protein [Alphaproteobacteria bacterium]
MDQNNSSVFVRLARIGIEKTLCHPAIFEWQQRTFNNYDNVKEEFAEQLDITGQRILDVGCSTGTAASQVIDMKTNKYIGIDVSEEYISTANQRYPDGNFIYMDARKMSFDDDSFDVVWFNGVLHHMDSQLISECLLDVQRVLKPDGRLLIAEPVFTPGMYLSNKLLEMDRGRFIRDQDGYRALLDGFSVERERFFSFSLHRFCSFVAKITT